MASPERISLCPSRSPPYLGERDERSADDVEHKRRDERERQILLELRQGQQERCHDRRTSPMRPYQRRLYLANAFSSSISAFWARWMRWT